MSVNASCGLAILGVILILAEGKNKQGDNE